ncbi:MAG: hypothetical protein JSV50_21415 [Desulfobacteraceae bacterium]|nr:MAG: hypothetical protein JSV50_21415 [Desulfobacteraceae bacterium]
MLNLEERTGFTTIFDFHVKKNMPIRHYLIFPEPIIPPFEYTNVPIARPGGLSVSRLVDEPLGHESFDHEALDRLGAEWFKSSRSMPRGSRQVVSEAN